MTRFFAPQKAVRGCKSAVGGVDRPVATVWYGPKTGEAIAVMIVEDANGRQEQRSGRALADA